MMDVFLIRASLTADDTVAEAQRHLSLEGRRIVREIGNKLRLADEPSFDRFFTSPLPAAIQTAELFADRVDYIGVVDVLPSLTANVPPNIAATALLASGANTIGVVADEPFLSALGAFLVGRPTFPPLVAAQVSVIRDRQPAWCFRPGEIGKSQLLVA
jgi:phosphohistidine phosphatase SixA